MAVNLNAKYFQIFNNNNSLYAKENANSITSKTKANLFGAISSSAQI